MILALVQPLGALFRCGSDHRLYVDHLLLFVCSCNSTVMGCYAGFYWLIAVAKRECIGGLLLTVWPRHLDLLHRRRVFNWLHLLNAVLIKGLAGKTVDIWSSFDLVSYVSCV